MLTDWVLIRRLAHELKDQLRGARVEDAGLLADGRIAILFRSAGMQRLLAVDLFASPPLVTLETEMPAILDEAGFGRALRRSLRGTVLADVSARRDDRLMRLSFGTRSRFGVSDTFECYLELVPRFGNAVLVKGDRVVAARKEFALSENPQRALQAGGPYLLPPLPPRTKSVATKRRDRRTRHRCTSIAARVACSKRTWRRWRASTTPRMSASRRCWRFRRAARPTAGAPAGDERAAGARVPSESVWTSASTSCAKS